MTSDDLGYGPTAGWSGSDTSRERAEADALSGAAAARQAYIQGLVEAAGTWSKPEYAAADKARNDWLAEHPNDQMGALAAAVDAAMNPPAPHECPYCMTATCEKCQPEPIAPAPVARLP